MNRGNWPTSPIAVVAVGLLLLAAGTALATSDLSGLVSTGSDDAATARGAQQPLGTLSATPQSDTGEGDILGETQAGGQGGAGNEAEELQGVAGEDVASPAAGTGTTDGEGLPFTGLLAIPLLAFGVVLLLAGTVLRRRVPPSPVSS
jgi:hypothetical protein